MNYHFEITAKAHKVQSKKDVFITEKGDFLWIYKRLRQLEERHSIEIDNVYIQAVTARENK